MQQISNEDPTRPGDATLPRVEGTPAMLAGRFSWELSGRELQKKIKSHILPPHCLPRGLMAHKALKAQLPHKWRLRRNFHTNGA
jgi:hypothetical protein